MDVMAAMYGQYEKKLTLDVSVPDIEKKIRDDLNAKTSPLGITKKEPKVNESIIPSAHKKSEPITKTHPSFDESIKALAPAPKRKISITDKLISTLHPGLRDDQIMPELIKSYDDRTKSERILNVIKKDVADQIRGIFNAVAPPGGVIRKEPKVDESIIPQADRNRNRQLKFILRSLNLFL